MGVGEGGKRRMIDGAEGRSPESRAQKWNLLQWGENVYVKVKSSLTD